MWVSVSSGLAAVPGLHDDDLGRGDQVQRRPNLFVEQIGIDVFRPQIGHLEVERRALRPNLLEFGGLLADFLGQANPGQQAVVSLYQMVDKIPGQRDAQRWPNDRARPLA